MLPYWPQVAIPSISKSFAWAISSRLSPLATSNVCSSPSLSINVTCNLCLELYQQLYASAPDILEGQAHSSPGFGGSRCPCIATGELENLRRAFGNIFCSDVHPRLRGLATASNNEPFWPHLRIDERSREVIGYNTVELIARVDRLTARVDRKARNMLSALLDRCSVSGE